MQLSGDFGAWLVAGRRSEFLPSVLGRFAFGHLDSKKLITRVVMDLPGFAAKLMCESFLGPQASHVLLGPVGEVFEFRNGHRQH